MICNNYLLDERFMLLYIGLVVLTARYAYLSLYVGMSSPGVVLGYKSSARLQTLWSFLCDWCHGGILCSIAFILHCWNFLHIGLFVLFPHTVSYTEFKSQHIDRLINYFLIPSSSISAMFSMRTSSIYKIIYK